MKAHPSALDLWPPLPWDEWKETATTLHMWVQMAGKTRLMLTPLENHWWNVPLYVTPRGLPTWSIPYKDDLFDLEFDFIDHQLNLRDSSGNSKSVALRPQSVAAFYEEYLGLLRSLNIDVKINPKPVESDPQLTQPVLHGFWCLLQAPSLPLTCESSLLFRIHGQIRIRKFVNIIRDSISYHAEGA